MKRHYVTFDIYDDEDFGFETQEELAVICDTEDEAVGFMIKKLNNIKNTIWGRDYVIENIKNLLNHELSKYHGGVPGANTPISEEQQLMYENMSHDEILEYVDKNYCWIDKSGCSFELGNQHINISIDTVDYEDGLIIEFKVGD